MVWGQEDWAKFNRFPVEVQRLVWKLLHREALQRVHEEYQLRFGNLWVSGVNSFVELEGWRLIMFANYRTCDFSTRRSGVFRFSGRTPVALLPQNYWSSGLTGQ